MTWWPQCIVTKEIINHLESKDSCLLECHIVSLGKAFSVSRQQLLDTQMTQCNIQEGLNHQQHYCEKIRSCKSGIWSTVNWRHLSNILATLLPKIRTKYLPQPQSIHTKWYARTFILLRVYLIPISVGVTRQANKGGSRPHAPPTISLHLKNTVL